MDHKMTWKICVATILVRLRTHLTRDGWSMSTDEPSCTAQFTDGKRATVEDEQTAPQLTLKFQTELTVMQHVPEEHCQRKTDCDRVQVPPCLVS